MSNCTSSSRNSKPSYYELLKHPLWQKKRLEILEAANFSCEDCGENDKTLSVHHTYYEKGLNPWEYPNKSLRCLCEKCHKAAQDIKTLLNRQMGQIDLEDTERLLGYCMALSVFSDPTTVLNPTSAECCLGIADFFRTNVSLVVDAIIDGSIDGQKLFDIAGKDKVSDV